MSGMVDPTPTVDAPSKPPQRFRPTRIAASVFFAVLTVALCVLWVRSYQRLEVIYHTVLGVKKTIVGSAGGYVYCNHYRLPAAILPPWGVESVPIDKALPLRRSEALPTHFSISDRSIIVPYWSLIVVSAVIAAVLWFSWSTRFSLRAMFIATTLVAVALGLGVWLAS
jgi:hypothetical protein